MESKSGPVFTKLFRYRIKIRLKLIKYVLQTRLILRILSFFMKDKVNLIVVTL